MSVAIQRAARNDFFHNVFNNGMLPIVFSYEPSIEIVTTGMSTARSRSAGDYYNLDNS